jgi:sensor histidine kinase YesM
MDLINETQMLDSNFFFFFFTERKYRVYRHLILVAFLAASIWKNGVLSEPLNTYAHLLLMMMVLLLFYYNMYYLVPRFLFKDKFLIYCKYVLLIIVIVLLVIAGFKYILYSRLEEPHRSKMQDINLFSAIFILVILIASSTTIKLFQRWVIDTQRLSELESITAQAELEQLKTQINPHFLFNTLNNANVLTKKDPEKASQVLMKLSGLLRYQLYDSTRSSVLLTSDIHFLEDFLNLEKIRRDHFDISVSQTGEMSGILIAPLLFIVFVENAVKHNMDAERESYVHLSFKVKDGELYFECVNSKPAIQTVNPEAGGLGLANIKRRLELLYPGRHCLTISDNPDSFTVGLIITL